MKKDFTITADAGGVFSTGEIDNKRIKPVISITYKDVESFPDSNIVDKDISDQAIALQKLYDTVNKLIENEERQTYLKYLQKLRKDIRWTEIDGELYPHVTSILNTINPIDFHMDQDKLNAYAARGNVLDFILQKYVETGEWIDVKDFPETWKHLKQMKVHKLEMSGDLPAWVEKYKPIFKEGHKQVINKKYKYVGEPDIAFGLLNDIPTLFDLKNRSNISKMEKVKIFKQMAAYAKADNIGNKIELLCIIIINDTTKRGYSEPVVTTKIDKYFDLFLSDLYEFKEMFKI